MERVKIIYNLTIVHTGRFKTKGEILEVYYKGDMIASSAQAEFEACRTLAERGLYGRGRFWREGKKHWDLEMDIKWGSCHTVMDTKSARLSFIPYRAFQQFA